MDQTQSILRALDPCRTDLLSLAATDLNIPSFGQPWHAQVFGLAMTLAQSGVFNWAQWVEAFSSEIRRHPQDAQEASEDAYYRQWLEALVALLKSAGVATDAELADMTEHWRRSYIATDHGKPVVFRQDLPNLSYVDDDHHHHEVRKISPSPVLVSRGH